MLLKFFLLQKPPIITIICESSSYGSGLNWVTVNYMFHHVSEFDDDDVNVPQMMIKITLLLLLLMMMIIVISSSSSLFIITTS